MLSKTSRVSELQHHTSDDFKSRILLVSISRMRNAEISRELRCENLASTVFPLYFREINKGNVSSSQYTF